MGLRSFWNAHNHSGFLQSSDSFQHLLSFLLCEHTILLMLVYTFNFSFAAVSRNIHMGRNNRASWKITLISVCFLSLSCVPREVWDWLGLLLHSSRGCHRHAAVHMAGLLLGQETEAVPLLTWSHWEQTEEKIGQRLLERLKHAATIKRWNGGSLIHSVLMKQNPLEWSTLHSVKGLYKICKRNGEHGKREKMDQRLKIL